MVEYVLAVFAVLVLTSTIIIYILKRCKLLDISMIISAGASSLILSLLFPFFSGIFGVLAFFFTIIAYIVVAFILSVIISSFINDSNVIRLAEKMVKCNTLRKLTQSHPVNKLQGLFCWIRQTNAREKTVCCDYFEEHDGVQNAGAHGEKIPVSEEKVVSNANNVGFCEQKSDSRIDSEKFVDSRQITDTMGIETGINEEKPVQSFIRLPKTIIGDKIVMIDDTDQDSDEVTWVSLDDDEIPAEVTEYIKTARKKMQEQVCSGPKITIEKLIDRAFELKKNGCYEEAAAEYMNILSMKPDKDLTFKVVLEICILYKDLGQKELARDILGNYLEQFGDEMNEVIKNQIKINLLELENANMS